MSDPAGAHKPDSSPSSAERRVERLAWLLDSAIRVPGTERRVGFDALIGLIPAGGDAAGAVLSGYILLEAARMGVPIRLLLKMTYNVALESVVGVVPVLGDLFDFAWKANERNVRLLRRHLADPQQTRHAGRGLLITGSVLLTVLLLGLTALGGWALWELGQLAFG
jgi:hypothetical protein